MRTLGCFLIGMLILPVILRADDFAGFRVPKHYVYSVTGSADGTFRRNGNESNTGEYKGWYLNGAVEGQGHWLFDSDPLRIWTLINANVTGIRSGNRSDTHDANGRGLMRESQRSLTEDWTASADLRVYPDVIPEFPLGLISSVNAGGGYDQQWSYQRSEWANDTEYSTRIGDSHAANYSYAITGNAGFGVGRVRDVSTVYDVYVVEKRLKESGVLRQALSRTARQKLINLIYFQGEYAAVHERPGKFFWQEFAAILKADSALTTTELDAYNLYRVAEPYFNISFGTDTEDNYPGWRERHRSGSSYSNTYFTGYFRQRGWFVGMLLFGSHHHQIRREEARTRSLNLNDNAVVVDTVFRSSNRSESSDDDLGYGPQAEFHLPVGPRWQFDATTLLRIYWQDNQHSRRWESSIHASYLLADRWFGTAYASHGWSELDQPWGAEQRYNKQWHVQLGSQLSYLLEDRISLYGRLYYTQSHSATIYQSPLSSSHTYGASNNMEIRVGIAYKFLGRLGAESLSAPSVLPPMRFE
jgi:hypothetical protein